MTTSGEAPVDEGIDKAREIIEDLLKEELQGTGFQIEEIFAKSDDDGGDGFLFVVVVYDPSSWEPDGTKIPDFTVHLRTALWNEGERRFPVMTYAREDEYRAAR